MRFDQVQKIQGDAEANRLLKAGWWVIKTGIMQDSRRQADGDVMTIMHPLYVMAHAIGEEGDAEPPPMQYRRVMKVMGDQAATAYLRAGWGVIDIHVIEMVARRNQRGEPIEGVRDCVYFMGETRQVLEGQKAEALPVVEIVPEPEPEPIAAAAEPIRKPLRRQLV